jgi:hypothetical protein
VSGRRDAMGRTDLLLSGSRRSKQAEGTKPKQQQTTTTEHHFLLPSLITLKTAGRGRAKLCAAHQAGERSGFRYSFLLSVGFSRAGRREVAGRKDSLRAFSFAEDNSRWISAPPELFQMPPKTEAPMHDEPMTE